MQKIKALRQRRAELVALADGVIKAADARGDGLTAAERSALDGYHADLDAVNGDIERYERHTDHLRAVGAVAANPAQAAQVEATGGFSNLAQFAGAVRQYAIGGPLDERLPRFMGAATNPHTGAGDEGMEIPPAFRDQIFMLMFADPFLGRINFEPTSSNVVEFTADETTPWAATGVRAYWAREAASMGASATKLDTKGGLQQIHKLFAFCNAGDELLSDAPRLNARLTVRASQAIRWKITEAVMNGDGVGKPLGYRRSSALVTVAKESSQSAAGIVVKNVSKSYARQIDITNAFWVANQDTLPELMELAIGNQPVWTLPQAGLREAPGGFLLGKPVMFSDHCQTMGQPGDLQFVNMDGYFASQRQGLELATSIHLYFDQGLQAFRWTVRIGGQPFLSAPVSPANGSNTRSYFVEIAVRP